MVVAIEKFSSWRRKGDSNPRYGYPYDSLANCWFQPLTHLSVLDRLKQGKDKEFLRICKPFGQKFFMWAFFSPPHHTICTIIAQQRWFIRFSHKNFCLIVLNDKKFY